MTSKKTPNSTKAFRVYPFAASDARGNRLDDSLTMTAVEAEKRPSIAGSARLYTRLQYSNPMWGLLVELVRVSAKQGK